MDRTCLKCGHSATDADTSPMAACPKCGAIYARVEAVRRPVPPTAAVASHASPARSFSTAQLVGAAVLALVIGYFAGREHLKSQMLSAFAAASGEVSRALSDVSTPTPPARAPTPSQTSPVTVSLVSKSHRPQDFSGSKYETEAVIVELAFANRSDKSIRAFDGTIVFSDLLDNQILAVRLEINDPIEARGSIRWEGVIEMNQFKSEHKRLNQEPKENLKIGFLPGKVLFADSSVTTY